jgi:trehalose/maltose transport system permease protein
MFVGYPLLKTLYFSFTNSNLGNLDHPVWIGVDNYIFLIHDPDWWRSVSNTFFFMATSLCFEAVFGLIVALILKSQLRGRLIIRSSILIPWAIPAVVSARMWSWILNDSYGVLNELLLQLGIIQTQIAWTANEHWTLFVLVFVDVWKNTPFMALVIFSGLQSIPESIYEASRVDGATYWEEFFFITLPLLKPALLVGVLFRALDALRIFDLPFVLTSNSKSTQVLSTYTRQQLIDFQEIGYGSSASFFIFCLTALFSICFIFFGKDQLGLKD